MTCRWTTAALLVPLLFIATPATSQEGERPDGVRLRSGIGLQAGALFMPVQTVSTNNVPVSERLTLGLVGIHSELGVQVNNLLGIYFKPAFDIGFGDIGALNLTIALMADFTFLDDALTLGGGVDVGGVFGLDFSSDGIGGAVGGMYGGRLRAAWNAFVSSDAPDAGRDALTIGLDMRFLFGAVVAGKLSPGSASGSAGVDFFFSPQLTIGYTGF